MMSATLEYFQYVLAPQMLIGLVLGVAVILVALGLTIIFGLLDVINMSHGEFYALGAFIAVALGTIGLPFWLLLMPNPYKPDIPIAGGVEAFGIFLPSYRLFLIVIGGAIIAAVAFMVYRTRLGAMVRAAAYDRHMAASLGVPVQHVYAGAFAFGVALAGLAGVLLAPIYSVFPTMGRDFILIAFTVVIVGGMGSIAGVVVAGLLLTQVQAIVSLYISPVWSDPIVFGIMVAMLMVRPQGLFGRLGHG